MILAAGNGIASGGEVSTTKKSTERFSSLQVGIYVWVGILVIHLPDLLDIYTKHQSKKVASLKTSIIQ